MSELPTIPGYATERLLGEGAYGRVYLARETEGLGRQVAIKLYTREGNADFQRELDALRKVEALRQEGAEGLVQSLATGEHEGQGFLVFEYLGAGSLADSVAADGPLPLERTLEVATQLSQALGALHAAGIWHRDVKPQNVLLGTDGKAKLADFGLARGLSGTLSAAGSPAFAAPEVIAGRPSDGPKADVYSLGATLIYALTGSTILPGRADVFVLEQAGVPRPVQRVLLQATTADPAARLANVSGLLGGLELACSESARLVREEQHAGEEQGASEWPPEKLPETARTKSDLPDLESDRTSERTSSMPYTTSPTATTDDYFATAGEPRTSKKAVWSLILALLVIPSMLGTFGVSAVLWRSAATSDFELMSKRGSAEDRVWQLESQLDAAQRNEDEERARSLALKLEEAQAEVARLRAEEDAAEPRAGLQLLPLLGLGVALGCEIGAAVLGILALMAIGKDPLLTGKGAAIGGLIVAGINGLLVLCIVPALMFSLVSRDSPQMQPVEIAIEEAPTPVPVAPAEPR